MRARVWGCRGSLAAPGPETVRYGGNTSCVEVRLSDGSVIVLDAGTGIRALGNALAVEQAGPIHVLLTHLHMDHLQGLAFFAPLWDADTELHVYGPRHPSRPLTERVASYLSEPLFPIHLSDVPSNPTFHEVGDEEFKIGCATILAMAVSHAGGPTVGYRIEDGGASLCYISDHEPARGVDFRSLTPAWISGFPLAEGVDVLIHDSQYSEEEYPHHVGWGHSSIDHVAHFGNVAKVRQLVLYHHDPAHSDATLEAMHARACELWEGDQPPVLAYEGMEFHLAK